ncbi:MAG: 6-phosphogluconolactonase [Phycisphaerales bacterium]
MLQDPGFSNPNRNGTSVYSLEKPNLPGRVIVAETVEALTELMAEDFVGHSLNCVRSFGDFHIALSGGESLVPFYRRLMIDPACRLAPWRKTHLWIVDERRTSWDDDESRWQTVGGFIGDHAGIPASQQHPMPALSDEVEEEYEQALRSALEWRERGHDRLDYVLLELGPSGEAAGLTPQSPALREDRRLVRINEASTSPRVTMTYPLINAARFVAVVVTGAKKRTLVERIASGAARTDELPILGVQPFGGELRWYLDRDACPTS